MNNDIPVYTVAQLKSLDNAFGQPFTAFLLIRKLTSKTASNGNNFLSVELGDRTGSLNCTVFTDNASFPTLSEAGEGAAIQVSGRVEYYQNKLSPKLSHVRVLDEAELENSGILEKLVETPPEPADDLRAELEGYIEAIRHDELRMTVRGVLEELGEAFYTSTAAVAMHHAYRHGLLEHTVHMARVCKAILPFYPQVDPCLAMSGIILHDAGKVLEYERGMANRRSRRGILQGHVVLGYRLARKHGLKARLDPERLERLEHIILSHQGDLAWGAAVYAATPEAVFVSMIDNLDAKMGMVQRALRQNEGSTEDFSERLPGLGTSILLRSLPPVVPSGELPL